MEDLRIEIKDFKLWKTVLFYVSTSTLTFLSKDNISFINLSLLNPWVMPDLWCHPKRQVRITYCQ